ncbi:pyridoxal phosphate-dependent aminotransferase [Oscillospiraceae bacterium OttesenSCG-928-F05]|nr:pyridoxal phosphate-dependent aminotransferase [Oscillospiraceae bacterium OttesenSCG-928-F05]
MPKELSAVARRVQASTTLSIDTTFKHMKAEGLDVIGFGAGEPDFNTPERIKTAAIQAIQDNFTRYTPSSGTLSLREAVCRRLELDCGLEYTPGQIVVSSGAKQSLFNALSALINPGDEVLLPAPYWVSYFELIKMVGGVPVILQTGAETGFKITPEMVDAAVTPKTKLLIFNSPSNPSGVVYRPAETEKIAAACVRHDLYVIADDIYYRLVYDGIRFRSIASYGDEIKERTIVINGVSKSYAMTGWRLGYAAANPEIAAIMGNFQSHASSSPSSISQMAAEEALRGPQDEIEAMVGAFEERRNYLVERFEKIPQIPFIRPEGAFYMMTDISAFVGKTLHGKMIRNSDDFASVFLERSLVALVPCTGFGAPNYLRWSYATSMENIREGTGRLEKFIQG